MNKLIRLFITAIVAAGLTACASPVSKLPTESLGAPEEMKPNTGEVKFIPSEKKTDFLYPAYKKQRGTRKWGYINNEGKFIIPPTYDWVDEFKENGLARVSLDGKATIIDRNGSIIVEPIYDYINEFSEGLATPWKDNNYAVLNEKGQIVIESKGYIGEFHNGLATIERKISDSSYLYGFINKEGKIVIEPQFEQAGSFENGKALVKMGDYRFAVIDTIGKILTEFKYKRVEQLSEDILIYTDEDDLKGYVFSDGKKLTDPVFVNAEPFKNGFAAVNESKEYPSTKYGIIDRTGNYIIKPEYGSIRYIGEGMFAACLKALDIYLDGFYPKAILNTEGVRLTDYKYYDIGEFSGGIASVSEDTVTYFIDKKGQKIDSLPQVERVGVMKILDGLIKADVDNEVYYYSKDGKAIWEPEMIQELASGIQIKSLKYSPDKCLLIYYPEILKLSDPDVQKTLNSKLREKFVGNNPVSLKEDGLYTESISIGFDYLDNKDLLELKKEGYYYPIGAAHGTPSMISFHINMKNGRFYTLADLFKKDSKYLKIITDILNKQITEKSKDQDSMLLVTEIDEISPDVQFEITESGLKIYFQPYEIAAYAAGFPEFIIPYSQLADIIDTGGEFWNSFNRQ